MSKRVGLLEREALVLKSHPSNMKRVRDAAVSDYVDRLRKAQTLKTCVRMLRDALNPHKHRESTKCYHKYSTLK